MSEGGSLPPSVPHQKPHAMNSNTLSAFQRILAEAKAKAEAQATGKPIPKPTPVPPPAPVVTAPVPTPPVTAPELSSTTIADLIGQPKVVTTPNKYNLKVISYSDKAVAVVGDTEQNKDRLRALGGKYNPYLRCGKGWIFPKYKEASIRSAFNL